MYRITTKQKDYNEVLGSLRFVDGVAQTDDKWMAEWCRGRGFAVEEVEPEAGKSAKSKTQKGKKQDDEGNAARETGDTAADSAAAGD